MKVLAGDIGGTKTLIQVAEVRGSDVEVLHRARFASQDYEDFSAVLHDYIAQLPAKLGNDISSACFGIAGPIHGSEQGTRRARVTNLPWQLDEAQLQSQLQLSRVDLINDFYATACGIEALRADDLAVLHPGTAHANAPRLVVGAGTGLGVAQLMWCDGRYRAFPSEGGHIHFAPTDSEQTELLDHMKSCYDRVSYERLVSGKGLASIYRFLLQRGQSINDPEHVALLESTDPAAAISEQARRGDDLAQQALSMFLAIYGAVVGDLALLSLPYGGIYVAGGIAPKLLAEMRSGSFMAAYGRKGRMSSLVEQMPIYVVMNQDVGLLGATLVPTQI
jgi:glucokinase